MSSVPCPQHDELVRFAVGRIRMPRQEAIDLHLQQCESCLRLLDAIGSDDDPVVACLQQPAPHVEFTGEAALADAIARIEQLPRRDVEGDVTYVNRHPITQQLESGSLRSLGRYQIAERLGQGGMGVVFKAVHPDLQKTVDLKVLPLTDGDDVERFRREMKSIGGASPSRET